MGRPKGSLNKPKIILSKGNETAVIRMNLEKQIESTPINRPNAFGWINWGLRNDFPQKLSALYYSSVTHRDCCDFSAKAIYGSGIDYEAMSLNRQQNQPNYQYTWDEFLKRISLDYIIYGSFAFQIIKNRDDKTYSFFHQSVADVRLGEPDEDGVITKCYISKDWTNRVKYPPVEIDRFGFQEDEEIKSGKAYLYLYEPYSPDVMFYWMPEYSSALKAIEAEIEMLRYDLASIHNNFSASGIITMQRMDDEADRKMAIENITAMFQGSDNANSVMVNFRNNDEEKPVEFTKIDKDVNHVNLFDSMNDRTIDRIISAHKIPSKQLVGITKDGAQLGGEGNEMKVAFKLYNTLIGDNNRDIIINAINKAMALNGIETELILKPLWFDGEIVSDSTDEDNTTTEDRNATDGDNTSEKATEENNGNTN